MTNLRNGDIVTFNQSVFADDYFNSTGLQGLILSDIYFTPIGDGWEDDMYGEEYYYELEFIDNTKPITRTIKQ